MTLLWRGKRAVELAVRTSKRPKLSELDVAKQCCMLDKDRDGLEKRFVSEFIGYGVFATQDFRKGDFLVEYCGKLISGKAEEITHNYLFGYKFDAKQFWIDGFDTERLGRYVNDAEAGTYRCNCRQKMLVFNYQPHICLFATRDIKAGEEIRYDYGDESGNLFWRHQRKCQTVYDDVTKNLQISCYPKDAETLENEELDDDPFDVEKERIDELVSDSGNQRSHGSGSLVREGLFSQAPIGALDTFMHEDSVSPAQSNASRSSDRAGFVSPFNTAGPSTPQSPESDSSQSHAHRGLPRNQLKEDSASPARSAASGRLHGEQSASLAHSKSYYLQRLHMGSSNDRSPVHNIEESVSPARSHRSGSSAHSRSGSPRSQSLSPLGTRDHSKSRSRSYPGSPTRSQLWSTQSRSRSGSLRSGSPQSRSGSRSPATSGKSISLSDHGSPKKGLPHSQPPSDVPHVSLALTQFSDVFIRNVSQPSAPQLSEQEPKEIPQHYKTVSNSAFSGAVQDAGRQTEGRDDTSTVAFVGMDTNYGFLKLFPELKLVENSYTGHVDIVIAPTDKNFLASKHNHGLFKAVLGRKKKIVSSMWVKDSVKTGQLQDKENYLVRGTELGIWSATEQYQHFDYQIGSGIFSDITIDEIRHLLNGMGGEEVLMRTHDTFYICADNELSHSGRCVHKEWLFQCITNGAVISTDGFQSTNSGYVSDSGSDANFSIISFQELQKKPEITVQSGKTRSGHRKSKIFCCVYCEVLTTKLPRHLETDHSNELEVARALSLKKKSAERKKAWAVLSAKGMFVNNTNVRSKGSGILIPKYRPRKQSLEKEYLPCEFCKADFVASALWKHHKSCPAKPGFIKSTAPVKNSRLTLPVSERCSEGFRKVILGKMRDTSISAIIRTDPLIIQYGERRYEKRGKHAHTHQYISEELRSLGRLLCAISEMDNSIKQLQQLLTAQNWEILLKGVKKVAEYDHSAQTFGKPSLAKKLGHYLQKCAKIVRINARKAGDKELKATAEDFLEQYEDDWKDRISSNAYESQSAAQYNKVQRLPLVEDVKKLKEYIEEEINETVKSAEISDVVKHNKLMSTDSCTDLVV